MKLEQRTRILVKLSLFKTVVQFEVIWFSYMAISLSQKIGKNHELLVDETPTLEVIFVIPIENSSVVTNNTNGPRKYQRHWKYLWDYCNMALKLPKQFYLLIEKPLLVTTCNFALLIIK